MFIEFDPDTHTYKGNGLPLQGVTDTLVRVGIAKYPDTFALRNARLRGKRVHLAVELHEKGTLDEESLWDDYDLAEQKIGHYLNGYKRFRDDWIARVLRFEMRVGHEIFLYAGTLDQLSITRDGRLVLWDFKTGEVPWWVHLQTGAYLEALLSMELGLESDEIWHGSVGLCNDGTYRQPVIERDRSGFGIFRQALNIVNYCDRRGR